MTFIRHSSSMMRSTTWKPRDVRFPSFSWRDHGETSCTASFVDTDIISLSSVAVQNIDGAEEISCQATVLAARKREAVPQRTTRGRLGNSQKVEDVICKMMAARAWTTRLQNSVRALVPQFNSSLVYNVIHGARSWEQALNFFRWVQKTGFRHDRETHFKIIQILGRVSKLNHARCILFDMPKKGVQWDEDLFVMLIDSYGKAGIVQESVKLFQKMKQLGVERTIKSYDTLFKVILRRGRYLMAKRYFNAMLREGIAPTEHTYNILLWGFFLCLQSVTACRYFEDMKSRGLVPNVVTYNTLINGWCRIKKIDKAEKLFAEMKGKNLIPNIISYTTMVKGFVSVGQVEEALRLLDEMGSAGIRPNDHTYSVLLPGLCDANKTVEIKKISKEMARRHLAPKDNSVFFRMLSCMCNSGDLDGALFVLNAMIRLHIPLEPAHYSLLIENFCNAGMYDRAVQMLDKVLEKQILLSASSTSDMEAGAYNPIIVYLCNNGQTAKAEVFFRQLMKRGVQDSAAFNNLICGHSKEGNPQLGMELLKIMQRRGIVSDIKSYETVIQSFLQKGEPADAKIALDSTIESGYLPSPSLFRSVMEALFCDERVQTASRVMNSMIEKGVMENLDLVSKILEALLLRGHVEEALGRIDLLINNGFAPDFDHLLTVLCEKDKRVAAVKLLDYGLDRQCNISFSSYYCVLDTLLAAGKTLIAYSVLCKIKENGGDTDWSSCEDLIGSLLAEGYTKQADNLSRVMGRAKKGQKVTVAST